jgi:hypothetical protein
VLVPIGADATTTTRRSQADILLERWKQGLLAQGYTAVLDKDLPVFARHLRLRQVTRYGPLRVDTTDIYIKVWGGDGELPILMLDQYGSRIFMPPGWHDAFWLSFKTFIRDHAVYYHTLLHRLKRETEAAAGVTDRLPRRRIRLSLGRLDQWPVAVRPFVDAWRDGEQENTSTLAKQRFFNVARAGVNSQFVAALRQMLIKQVGVARADIVYHPILGEVTVTLDSDDMDKFLAARGTDLATGT